MLCIVFIAPPAAGKGFASSYIENKYQIPRISMGDILRKKKDEEVKKTLKSGNLVSDDICNKSIQEYISKIDNKKAIIIDGYPRTLYQAKFLENLEANNELIVINLKISKEKALKRSLARIICPNCHMVYNINNEKLKPINENICDVCQTKLESRTDDNEESFNRRFEIYLEDTLPIINYYKSKGILYTVESVDNIEKFYSKLDELIKEALND